MPGHIGSPVCAWLTRSDGNGQSLSARGGGQQQVEWLQQDRQPRCLAGSGNHGFDRRLGTPMSCHAQPEMHVLNTCICLESERQACQQMRELRKGQLRHECDNFLHLAHMKSRQGTAAWKQIIESLLPSRLMKCLLSHRCAEALPQRAMCHLEGSRHSPDGSAKMVCIMRF